MRYEEPPLEYGRHLDGDFAIGVTIAQESKANTVEVCDAVQRRIAQMNDDPELKGVNFLTWFSQGAEIQKTLKDLLFTGIFGAILAAFVLYAFLRRFSTTLVSVSCIPFSLVVACGFIWARGGSMNTLVLLGLIVAIGMLVDNAVVVMENIFRHQEMGENQKDATRKGSAEVSIAVIAATLDLGDRVPAAHLQQAERDEHLSEGARHRGVHRDPGLALHQPDADPAGDLVVHQIAAETQDARDAQDRVYLRAPARVQPQAPLAHAASSWWACWRRRTSRS